MRGGGVHCGSDSIRCSLTGAVLVVSVPGDGSDKVDAGESRYKALEAVSLASIRAVGPVPGDESGGRYGLTVFMSQEPGQGLRNEINLKKKHV